MQSAKKNPHERHRAGAGLEGDYLLGAAEFFQHVADILHSCSDSFLDTAYQFIVFPFRISQIIVRQLTVRLLELAFDNVPVSLEIKFGFSLIHGFSFVGIKSMRAISVPARPCGEDQPACDSDSDRRKWMLFNETLERVP